MNQREALQLITYKHLLSTSQPVVWADLGCGAGTFTTALANQLPSGSTLYAIDKDPSALSGIPPHESVTIEKRAGNFMTDALPDNLDGILMANALHYVEDQATFINKLGRHLKNTACLVIVEYDTDRANPWVPYPVPFLSLPDLVRQSNFISVEKISERPSLYGNRKMYSAILRKA